jgi:sugar phosphate isomerase/epimerase
MGDSLGDDLILCSATLMLDPTDPGPGGLAIQVEATKAAGFAGLSLWRMHAEAAVASLGSPDVVRDFVLGAGLRVPIVEAMMPWDEVDYGAASTDIEPFLELAESYGSEHLLAVTMSTERLDVALAAKRLREVCDRAADRGLGIVIEFLPWSGIPDLATAWQIVESSGAENAGLLIDAWHWQRQPGGPSPDLLRSIPPDRFKIFQICDAADVPQQDPLEECLRDRRLPGDGAVDLRGLVALFDEIGATPIVAPEVFNRALASKGATAMAIAVRDATEKVLDRTVVRGNS